MSGGGIFQKTNTQGLGAGVIPSASTLNNRDYLISQGRGIRANSGVATKTGSMQSIQNQPLNVSGPHNRYVSDSGTHPAWESGYGIRGFTGVAPNGNIRQWGGYRDSRDRGDFKRGSTSKEYTADEIAALKLEYDNDEALRQDKLDKMSQLAQGQGGSGGGVSGQIVGDGGDLNIQQVAMERGKDGFPTLADFEQPLHPFMGKRKLNLKGYA